VPRNAGPTGDRSIAAIVAAFEGALESVPFIVVAGLIAFAPLGEAMPGIGIAAFLGALLVSLLEGVGADRRGLVAGPSLGLALIVAGALEASIHHGALTEHDARAALSLSMGLTIGCGVLMAAISAVGIGRLAPLVPYPVLAGLRNGIAVLLVLERFRAAAGMPEHGHGCQSAAGRPRTPTLAIPNARF
jgi:MFS superfamily sulfate permease-like transporter